MYERPILTISEGKIQGIKSKSVLGPDYFSFKGIPFAQPPIGPLRFKVNKFCTHSSTCFWGRITLKKLNSLIKFVIFNNFIF